MLSQMDKSRTEALALLQEFTQSQSLLKHAFAVEASMRWYAQHFNCTPEQSEQWGITGLLHDFDYQKYPEPTAPDGHPYRGNSILQERGYSEEIRTAIMGHALYTDTPRVTQMAKTLFAVDELSGLVMASVLVRPDKKIAELEPRSVLKKMKDKAFARGCNRDDIRNGAIELGIELDQHVANVIDAMKKSASILDI